MYLKDKFRDENNIELLFWRKKKYESFNKTFNIIGWQNVDK